MKRTFTQLLSLVLVLFAMQTAYAQPSFLDINSPGSIAGTLSDVGEASAPDWPGALELGETVTGDLVYVSANVDDMDDVPDDIPVMGCVELGNADEVSGNIALVQRGACTFSAKVKAAEDAGAIAVVICNNRPDSEDGGGVVNMAPTAIDGYTNGIPAVFLSQEDCAPIRMLLDNDETVNVTLGVQQFVELATNYNRFTPVENIVPMWGIGAIFYDVEVQDALLTATITDPNGVETVVTGAGMTDPAAVNGVIISVDEPYLPTVAGTYTVVGTNNLNNGVLTEEFVITDENFFQTGNSEFAGGVQARGEDFVNGNFTYHIHIVIRTGGSAVFLNDVEFGLANWEEIQTDAASDVTFTAELYDVTDASANDGTLGFPETTTTDYIELFGDALAFTQYTASGEEMNMDIVSADFSLNPLGGIPTLEAERAYLVAIKYNGENVANEVPPSYVRSGTVPLPTGLDGSIWLGDWSTGFIGSPSIHIRANTPLVDDSSVEPTLPAAAIAVSPNPATAALNIEVTLENTSDEVNVQVVDAMGRLVLDRTTENVRQTTLTYDVSAWATGTYLVRIATDEGTRTEKFVKN